MPGQMLGVDLCLDQGRVGLGVRIGQSVALGQAVPEEENGMLGWARRGEQASLPEDQRNDDHHLPGPGGCLYGLDRHGSLWGPREPNRGGRGFRAACLHWPSLGASIWSVPMPDQAMLRVHRLTKTYWTAAGAADGAARDELRTGCGIQPRHRGSQRKRQDDASRALCGPGPSHGGFGRAGRPEAGFPRRGRPRARQECERRVRLSELPADPDPDALENVLVPLELRGERGCEPQGRALLERVGLGARAAHYPVQLSGGEQQRVALARAFINAPKILFCDEPTGNLDGDNADAMVELIFGLNRERATTLVLVTHNAELAGRCQRILRLKNGSVVSDELAPAAR